MHFLCMQVAGEAVCSVPVQAQDTERIFTDPHWGKSESAGRKSAELETQGLAAEQPNICLSLEHPTCLGTRLTLCTGETGSAKDVFAK